MKKKIYSYAANFFEKVPSLLSKKPTHDKNWGVGQKVLPSISIKDDHVTIDNFRNFTWHEVEERTPENYEKTSFHSSHINGVDVVISHFSNVEAIAHVFLLFKIKDQDPIAISIEARLEQNQNFSPWKGLWGNFELIYVAAAYNDIIPIRKDIRKETVYQYPLLVTAKQSKDLFLLLSNEMNQLKNEPRFYNTLVHNCANSVTNDMERLTSFTFPHIITSFEPGELDKIMYDMNIINKEETLHATREKHRIK